jgi:hypothetical protein
MAKHVPDADLIAAYEQLGSVHKVGMLVGLNHATVHNRLTKLGVQKPMNVLGEADKQIIRDYYEKTPDPDFDLTALAKSIGRTRPFTCRAARAMGLTRIDRPVPMKPYRAMVERNRTGGQSRYPQPERVMGIKFRSRWESNYALYLEWLKTNGRIRDWKYEPVTFWFEKIKRGVRSYTPDFQIWTNAGTDHFIEIKGWMDKRSLTKLKRMRIYHPKVEIRLFVGKDYKALQKRCEYIVTGWVHSNVR